MMMNNNKEKYVSTQLAKLRLSQKGSYLLQDPANVIFTEGSTRTGKSYLLGVKFFKKMFLSEADQTEYFIGAVSLDRLKQFLINDENSFYHMFKQLCEYKPGEYMINIQGLHGIKHLYFIGYTLATSWTKIRGANISGMLLEEVNLAHDTFLNEAFGRALALPWSFLYANSNGDDPAKECYTKHLNKCRPLPMYKEEMLKEEVTAKIYTELLRAKAEKNWRYYHFGFRDNPILTKSRIASIKSGYNEGTHEWLTMVLGGRGVREGAIFAPHMTYDRNTIAYDSIWETYQIVKYTLGIDVGSADFTVFTLVGFTANYNKAIVIDKLEINKVGTTAMWEAFVQWWKPYTRLDVHGAFFDYAGGGSIVRDELNPKLSTIGIKTGELFKYKILQRCIAGQKLFADGRIIISDKIIDVYEGFMAAVWHKDRTRPDCRVFGFHKHKDFVDSVEYAMSPFLSRMLSIKE